MIHTDMSAIFSPYIIAFVAAYLLTEGIKIVGIIIKTRAFRWREFFKSGGMPSSHSADVTALAVTVGMLNGFGSALFGIAAGFAAIVMYDAMNVRRAVGEQGTVLRKIIERDAKLELEVSELLRKKPADKLREPYFTRGHRGIEVAVGGIIGAVIGWVVAVLSV